MSLRRAKRGTEQEEEKGEGKHPADEGANNATPYHRQPPTQELAPSWDHRLHLLAFRSCQHNVDFQIVIATKRPPTWVLLDACRRWERETIFASCELWWGGVGGGGGGRISDFALA